MFRLTTNWTVSRVITQMMVYLGLFLTSPQTTRTTATPTSSRTVIIVKDNQQTKAIKQQQQQQQKEINSVKSQFNLKNIDYLITNYGEMLQSSPVNNNGTLIKQSTVFLGGSCNPTTWRKDIAIPMLEALNITYYDPQKDHWEPELIELEDKAKKNADVLFFVINNQTRAIAAMIEVSFLAATTNKLILVIDLYPTLESIINNETISPYEHEILKNGRNLLRKLVERKGMPVFNQIPAALSYIPQMIEKNSFNCSLESSNKLSSQPPTTTTTATTTTLATTSVTDKEGDSDQLMTNLVNNNNNNSKLTFLSSHAKLIKVQKVFNSFDDTNSGYISLLDCKLAYRLLTGIELDESHLQRHFNITKESFHQFPYNHRHDGQEEEEADHFIHHQQQHQINTNSSFEHHDTVDHVRLNHAHPDQLNHCNYVSYKESSVPMDDSSSNVTNTINFNQFCQLILDHLNLSFTNSPNQRTNHLSSITSPVSTTDLKSSSFVNKISKPISSSDNMSNNNNNNNIFLPSCVNQSFQGNCDCDQWQLQNKDYNGNRCKDLLINNVENKMIKDIFLAGSDNPKGWRSDIAIPLIEKSGLTYSMPKVKGTSSYESDSVKDDLCSLECCRVLLFVIGGQSPELETMILASHYFGQRYKVCLCIQPIPEESIAKENKISQTAINDYNRGRAYLSEMARKENIHVCDNLEKAVKCAITLALS